MFREIEGGGSFPGRSMKRICVQEPSSKAVMVLLPVLLCKHSCYGSFGQHSRRNGGDAQRGPKSTSIEPPHPSVNTCVRPTVRSIVRASVRPYDRPPDRSSDRPSLSVCPSVRPSVVSSFVRLNVRPSVRPSDMNKPTCQNRS